MYISLMSVIFTECLGLILNLTVEDPPIYQHVTANFGIQLSDPSYERSAPLVWTVPEHGCGHIENGSELDGSIVIVKRGQCSFFEQALNIRSYGGIGIVIGNDAGSQLIRMIKLVGENGEVDIPSVLISEWDYSNVTHILTQRPSKGVVAILSANGEYNIDDFPPSRNLARAFAYMMLILPSTWTIMVLLWACLSLAKRRITQTQVREIPEVIFSSDLMEAKSLNRKHLINYTCPICLIDFVEQTRIKLLPCDHGFHPGCIEPWIEERNDSCPICRQTIMDKLEVAHRGVACCYSIRRQHSQRENSNQSLVEAAVFSVQNIEHNMENYNSSNSIEQYPVTQLEQTSELDFLSESQPSIIEAGDDEVIGEEAERRSFLTIIVHTEER